MQNENTVSFMVIAGPDSANRSMHGLGRKEFRIAPRTGEYIELEDQDRKAHLYKVKAVVHPNEPTTNAGDLFVEHLGLTGDVLKSLYA